MRKRPVSWSREVARRFRNRARQRHNVAAARSPTSFTSRDIDLAVGDVDLFHRADDEGWPAAQVHQGSQRPQVEPLAVLDHPCRQLGGFAADGRGPFAGRELVGVGSDVEAGQGRVPAQDVAPDHAQ